MSLWFKQLILLYSYLNSHMFKTDEDYFHFTFAEAFSLSHRKSSAPQEGEQSSAQFPAHLMRPTFLTTAVESVQRPTLPLIQQLCLQELIWKQCFYQKSHQFWSWSARVQHGLVIFRLKGII